MICGTCDGIGYVEDPIGIARACTDCETWGHRCDTCGAGCEDGCCGCETTAIEAKDSAEE